MRSIKFTDKASKQFKSLDQSIQKQIKKKMLYFCSCENPIEFATKLVNFEYGNYRFRIGDYRFRIGDYRVICDIDDEGCIIIIALVGHRRDIYE